jgi:hypothetical protein
MISKLLILVFLGLLSVVSPPVFIGIVLLVVISVSVCNIDISMEKISKALSAQRSARPLKLPCNFLVIGLLFTGIFSLIGFIWGGNPHIADEALEMVRMSVVIGLHFISLMLLVGSMYKFVKLVD